MSQTGSTTRTVGSLGSSTDSGGGGGSFSHKKYQRSKERKIVRILTVFAYVMSVSTVALVLSIYYLFIWKPSPPEQLTNIKRGYPADSNLYALHSRQSSSSFQSPPYVTPSHSVRNKKKPYAANLMQPLPTPQAIISLSNEVKEEMPLAMSTGHSQPEFDIKSTATPHRAPASAPEGNLPSKTTPSHLLKIIAPLPTMPPI